jgi:hypothetical protein
MMADSTGRILCAMVFCSLYNSPTTTTTTAVTVPCVIPSLVWLSTYSTFINPLYQSNNLNHTRYQARDSLFSIGKSCSQRSNVPSTCFDVVLCYTVALLICPSYGIVCTSIAKRGCLYKQLSSHSHVLLSTITSIVKQSKIIATLSMLIVSSRCVRQLSLSLSLSLSQLSMCLHIIPSCSMWIFGSHLIVTPCFSVVGTGWIAVVHEAYNVHLYPLNQYQNANLHQLYGTLNCTQVEHCIGLILCRCLLVIKHCQFSIARYSLSQIIYNSCDSRQQPQCFMVPDQYQHMMLCTITCACMYASIIPKLYCASGCPRSAAIW